MAVYLLRPDFCKSEALTYLIVEKTLAFIFVFFAITFIPSLAQTPHAVSWKGRVVHAQTGEPIPNAVIAVFSQVVVYSADEQGEFRIALLPNDSVRVAALGFEAATYTVQQSPTNDNGLAVLKLYPVSYKLKEVEVKGYRGILDPLIFPQLADDKPKIELNLPSHFGSRMSKTPPNERPLMAKPTPLSAVFSPLSFGYSVFSKEEKSKRNLIKARYQEHIWDRLDNLANRETLAMVSGFEGEALDDFVIYCNLHLKLNSFDNGASAVQKIEQLLKKYLTESSQE